jgi:hypothetical protein
MADVMTCYRAGEICSMEEEGGPCYDMWALLRDDSNDGLCGATYAQTASETTEGCKLNGV